MAINEGRLKFMNTHVDELYFPVHTTELQEKKILDGMLKTKLKTSMLGGQNNKLEIPKDDKGRVKQRLKKSRSPRRQARKDL